MKNGSKLVLAERNSSPLVELEIVFNKGYAVETNDKLGLVNFTMSMVDEGTENYSSLKYAEKIKSKIIKDLNKYSSNTNSLNETLDYILKRNK